MDDEAGVLAYFSFPKTHGEDPLRNAGTPEQEVKRRADVMSIFNERVSRGSREPY